MSTRFMIIRFILSIICYLILGSILKALFGEVGKYLTLTILVLDVTATSIVVLKNGGKIW